MALSHASHQRAVEGLLLTSTSVLIESDSIDHSDVQVDAYSTDDDSDDFGGALLPTTSYTLSPAVSKTSIDSKTQLEQAIFRSLADQLPLRKSECGSADRQKNTSEGCNEEALRKEFFTNKGRIEITLWKKGHEVGRTPEDGLAEQDFLTDRRITEQWTTEHTELQSSGLIEYRDKNVKQEMPDSSVLAFMDRKQENLKVEENAHKRIGSQELKITRTLDADRDVVVVSAIPRKRKGRKNQSSYYDITSELRYLR